MAAQSWAEWFRGLWPRLPPTPGSHEARLEELRVFAQLDREARKPVGQRDEELVHKLSMERRKLGLENAQVCCSTRRRQAAAELKSVLGQAHQMHLPPDHFMCRP